MSRKSVATCIKIKNKQIHLGIKHGITGPKEKKRGAVI